MTATLRLEHFPVVIPAWTHYAGVTRAGHDCRIEPSVWDSFNDLRPSGKLHHAQDIMAAEGALIVAAREGEVTSVGYGDHGGNFAYVRDSDGFTHYYAHMLKPARVSKHQRVQAGHVLGYVGRTGNAVTACPHLHYATKSPSNAAVNPYSELQRLFDAGDWRGSPFASPVRKAVLVGALVLGVGTLAFRVGSFRGWPWLTPRPWLVRLLGAQVRDGRHRQGRLQALTR